MNYPTLEQVEAADREQICRWYRFLPSPGLAAVGKEEFERVMASEGPIMDRIYERFYALGGFNAELSKRIGWDKS